MRLCRFHPNGFGLVEGSNVRDITAALPGVLPLAAYPFPRHDALIAGLDRVLASVKKLEKSSLEYVPSSLKLLSPVANPGKIIGAPVNYQKHLDEVRADAEIHAGNAIAAIHRVGLFLKATSALVGPSEGIALRHLDRRSDHEVELAVIIGKTANKIPAERALEHVAAYSIGLDITLRGPEERSFRKSTDSYAVLGPWLVTADEIPDPNNLRLSLSVNGEVRQDSSTSRMIMSVKELIAYASAFYTLHPGDIIMTGTPEGVSAIQPGDTISATIEGIGSMEVRVRAAE
jgi:2-keto-4-pentenoate hydratase/2-oxohepta-3-ene-1,7-dioic acid hydratase in catechol pathway